MPTTEAPPGTNGQGDMTDAANAIAKATRAKQVDLNAAVGRFLKARDETNAIILESESLIDAIYLGILSKTHVYVAGEGGTGKTAAGEETSHHFTGGEIFYTQFRADTKREEVFGPLSVQALQNDLYLHVTTGMLPKAHVAILDEIKDAGKFNRQLLNALNERWFVNGGVREDIPLMSALGLTNFWMEEQELAALFDRFAQRLKQEPIKTSEGFKAVIRGAIERDTEAAGGTTRNRAPRTVVTLEELAEMQRQARLVDVSADIVDMLEKLWRSASAAGLEPSIRRYNEGVRLARANALLRGDTNVIPEDLRVFARVLPNHPDDFKKARELCKDFKDRLTDAIDQGQNAVDELRALLEPARAQLAAGEKVSDFAPIPKVQQQSTIALKKLGEAVKANGGNSSSALDRVLEQIMAEQKLGQDIALGRV